MELTPNDVLSGRGASFSRHPGNEIFRRMLNRHRAVYSNSSKAQKVAISTSIVETIYSMEPPGRFLRKCADTGQWEELSKKEALNKAAQAMAYAVRDMAKVETERSHSLSSTNPGMSRVVPSQITLSKSVAHASAASAKRERRQDSNVASEPNNGRADQSADNSSESPGLQRLLLQLQQPSAATLSTNQNPTTSMPIVSLNRLAQLLTETDAQLQQNQQRQRELLLYLAGQRQLQPQTQLASASLSPTLAITSSPSLSAQSQGALMSQYYDIVRRASPSSLLQGSSGTTSLQLSSLLGLQSITNQQGLLSSLMGGLPQNRSVLGTGIVPRQQSVDQLQCRLDSLRQNQLLSSLTQNQLLLQQPLRPLDPLQQAWRDSVLQQQLSSQSHHNLTHHSTLQPLLLRLVTSSSLTASSARRNNASEDLNGRQ